MIKTFKKNHNTILIFIIPLILVLIGLSIYKDYGVSLDEALGVFGLTGMTAWFGVNEIGKPKSGDVFVVSSAAGATGSIAGQLARAMGCRVVGITSTDEKCQWLTDSIGFNAAINYTHQD